MDCQLGDVLQRAQQVIRSIYVLWFWYEKSNMVKVTAEPETKGGL